MCGRYTLKTPAKELAEVFGTLPVPEMAPRYNVAPSQQVLMVRGVNGAREAALASWGLLPRFIADPAKGLKPINARAETVAKSPMFRFAFQNRRCLMPADGFYEWQKLEAKRKQPWYFALKDGGPFAFAAVWERWGEGDAAVESCALITGAPNELVKPVHDRMPVIVPAEKYEVWLDPAAKPAQLLSLLVPYPADEMDARAVSTRVNSPRNEGPELIDPM